MNVRVIVPRKAAPSPGSSWSRRDEDRGAADDEPEPAGDDLLDLLLDLKSVTLAYLRRAPEHPVLARRAELVERDLATLRRVGERAGHPLSPAPRVDLGAGLAALAAQAGVEDFDPFANEADLLTGALVLNALGLAVIQGFLAESDGNRWRTALLPVLADDARFEGWLNGALAAAGEAVVERAAELRALASSPGAASGRLWSFDLLRMAVCRLLCGGQRGHRGGFFPDGMSGTAG